MKKILFIVAIASISLNPTFSFAAPAVDNTSYDAAYLKEINGEGAPPPLDYSGFVDCDGVPARARDAQGKDTGPKVGEEKRQTKCDFAALMRTVTKLINWMFFIAVPLAAVLFAYGGLLYMSGKPGNRTTANGIFTSVAIGFIIMITAWIVVRTVVGWLVPKDSTATIFLDGPAK